MSINIKVEKKVKPSQNTGSGVSNKNNPNSGSYRGVISKLKACLESTSLEKALNPLSLVQYSLPIQDTNNNTEFPLNPYLGKTLTLKFEQEIRCIHCDKKTKKSFNQGYCYPCFLKLARCDVCIIRPEKCHYHLGTCREPDWAQTHCFIPHVIYLANTSGLKVGITRETQIPTRWIDQGATQALPILKVQNRAISGLIEVALKAFVNDKTDWRKMLKGENEKVDLCAKRDELINLLKNYNFENSADILNYYEVESNFVENNLVKDNLVKDNLIKNNLVKSNPDSPIKSALDINNLITIQYPVLEYPQKVTSLNLEKTPEISGTLLGIKGQYLIFDVGVLNVRNLTGYVVNLKFTE